MSRAPTVSVIMPAYNARATLEQAVISIQDQSLADWELLIVNDGSNDGTGDLAQRLALREPRVRLIEHRSNLGVSAARNSALNLACGQFVSFLDADDWLEPDALRMLIQCAEQSGVGGASGGFRAVSIDGEWLHEHVNRQEVLALDDLIDQAHIPTGSHIVARARFDDTRFDPALDAYEDLDVWLRLSATGVRWATVPDIVITYRILSGSLARRALHMGESCCHVLGRAFDRSRRGESLANLDDDSHDRERRACATRILTYATRELIIKGEARIEPCSAALQRRGGVEDLDPNSASSAAWFGVIFGLGARPCVDLFTERGLDQLLRHWWSSLRDTDFSDQAWAQLVARCEDSYSHGDRLTPTSVD